jgi:predicted alpha/beta-hydrolase family hydrolase
LGGATFFPKAVVILRDQFACMPTQNFTLQISPEIGKVSATMVMPEKPICLVVLAHGAGAGMHHTFMVSLAEALAETNIGTLRFNFPFIENSKRRPDLPAVAHQVIEAALHHAKKDASSLPLFLSGKSFGGRMGSQYMALHNDSAVEGLIFYGFPLHPPKKPSITRAEHLKQIKKPMLFLQGTRDALAEISLIEEVCSPISNATLLTLEGADHAFKKGKENLVPQLGRLTREWIDTILL